MPELVAKGLLTRTELIDAIGGKTPSVSPLSLLGLSMESGHSFLLAIFLPSFVFVALLNPMVKKMRNLNLLPHF
jgi:chromate transporter